MAYLDSRNFSRNPFLNAFGITRPRYYYTSTMTPAVLFGTGVLIGAGIALMVAPKSGRELRNDLSRQANQLTERVRERVPALQGKDKQQSWESVATT